MNMNSTVSMKKTLPRIKIYLVFLLIFSFVIPLVTFAAPKTIESLTSENATLKAKIKELEKKIKNLETQYKTVSNNNPAVIPDFKKSQPFTDYIEARKAIIVQIETAMQYVGNTNVRSYRDILKEALVGMEKVLTSINALVVPNNSASDYIIKDKNLLRELQSSYAAYLQTSLKYQDALESKSYSAASSALNEVTKAQEKMKLKSQELQNNFEYVIYEYDKARNGR